jgi:DNA-binding XRE family transcriptional regulator
MPTRDETPTVASAIGSIVRRIRNEHRISRDTLARAGSHFGVTWGRTTIENIEAGRFSPTIPTLYVLCQTLSSLAKRNVALLDLFPPEGLVEIGDDFAIPVQRLRRFLGDEEAVQFIGDGLDELLRTLNGPPPPPSLTEERAAKKLGVDVRTLQRLARDVFTGDSLEDVVRQSTPPDASPQARGHETRHYVQEIANHIEHLKRSGEWTKWSRQPNG